MRIKLFLLLITVLFGGCSTLRGSLTAGSIIGASLGAMSGAVFSPNKESVKANALVFGSLGAVSGTLLAHYFYTNDPENRDLKHMMIPEIPPVSKNPEVGFFDFHPELKNMKSELKFNPVKKYEVPIEKLPVNLQGKVKKQYLLEYESEPRTIQYEGKTIDIESFKAYEHTYEE